MHEESDEESDDDLNFSFHQADDQITLTKSHMINQNCILLDSESTVSVFSNKRFPQNIRHCGTDQGLRVHSNGGFQDTHMIGDLASFGAVWCNQGSMANILSERSAE